MPWTKDASAERVGSSRLQLTSQLAWLACGLTLALLAAALLLPADTPVGVTGLAPLAVWAAANAVVGAMVAARRSENPIGWLRSTGGLLVGFGLFAGQYAFYTLVTRPGSLPLGQAMLWLSAWIFDAGFFLVLFLLLLFPTGRLPSPRWRPVARFAVAVYLADLVGRAFVAGPVNEDEFGPLRNPLGIEATADLAPLIISLVTTLLLVALLAAVGSLLVRLRRAQGVERQQLKWFCYAAALSAAAAFVAVALPSVGGYTADTVSITLGLTALPVSVGCRRHVIDEDGTAGFGGSLNVGDTRGHVMGEDTSLKDAAGATAMLVVRDHGPAQPGTANDQIHSLAACNPTCTDLQLSVHPTSRDRRFPLLPWAAPSGTRRAITAGRRVRGHQRPETRRTQMAWAAIAIRVAAMAKVMITAGIPTA